MRKKIKKLYKYENYKIIQNHIKYMKNIKTLIFEKYKIIEDYNNFIKNHHKLYNYIFIL